MVLVKRKKMEHPTGGSHDGHDMTATGSPGHRWVRQSRGCVGGDEGGGGQGGPALPLRPDQVAVAGGAVTSLESRHQRAVNVVRWSPDGSLLASGDDESVIIVWKVGRGGGVSVTLSR